MFSIPFPGVSKNLTSVITTKEQHTFIVISHAVTTAWARTRITDPRPFLPVPFPAVAERSIGIVRSIVAAAKWATCMMDSMTDKVGAAKKNDAVPNCVISQLVVVTSVRPGVLLLCPVVTVPRPRIGKAGVICAQATKEQYALTLVVSKVTALPSRGAGPVSAI